MGTLAGGLRHRPRAGCARDAGRLADGLLRHHDQGAGGKAQARVLHRGGPARRGLAAEGPGPHARRAAGGQRGRARLPGPLPPRPGQPAAQGDPVRHAGRRHLVARPPAGRTRAPLDPPAHRWPGHLLHHAAGGQRHLQRPWRAPPRPAGWT
jgi:hypothetical protein